MIVEINSFLISESQNLRVLLELFSITSWSEGVFGEPKSSIIYVGDYWSWHWTYSSTGLWN